MSALLGSQITHEDNRRGETGPESSQALLVVNLPGQVECTRGATVSIIALIAVRIVRTLLRPCGGIDGRLVPRSASDDVLLRLARGLRPHGDHRQRGYDPFRDDSGEAPDPELFERGQEDRGGFFGALAGWGLRLEALFALDESGPECGVAQEVEELGQQRRERVGDQSAVEREEPLRLERVDDGFERADFRMVRLDGSSEPTRFLRTLGRSSPRGPLDLVPFDECIGRKDERARDDGAERTGGRLDQRRKMRGHFP